MIHRRRCKRHGGLLLAALVLFAAAGVPLVHLNLHRGGFESLTAAGRHRPGEHPYTLSDRPGLDHDGHACAICEFLSNFHTECLRAASFANYETPLGSALHVLPFLTVKAYGFSTSGRAPPGLAFSD